MTDPGSKQNPSQLGACFDRSRFENPLPTVQLNRFHDSTNSGRTSRTEPRVSLAQLFVCEGGGHRMSSTKPFATKLDTRKAKQTKSQNITEIRDVSLPCSALDFTPATRNVPIMWNHAASLQPISQTTPCFGPALLRMQMSEPPSLSVKIGFPPAMWEVVGMRWRAGAKPSRLQTSNGLHSRV